MRSTNLTGKRWPGQPSQSQGLGATVSRASKATATPRLDSNTSSRTGASLGHLAPTWGLLG